MAAILRETFSKAIPTVPSLMDAQTGSTGSLCQSYQTQISLRADGTILGIAEDVLRAANTGWYVSTVALFGSSVRASLFNSVVLLRKGASDGKTNFLFGFQNVYRGDLPDAHGFFSQ